MTLYKLMSIVFGIVVFLLIFGLLPVLIKKQQARKYHEKWGSVISLPNYIRDKNDELFSHKLSGVQIHAQNTFFSDIYDRCSFCYQDRNLLEYITLEYTEYFIRCGHIQESCFDALMLLLYKYGINSVISQSHSLSSDRKKADDYMCLCEYHILYCTLQFMEQAQVGFLPDRMMIRHIESCLHDPRYQSETHSFTDIFNQKSQHYRWKELSEAPNHNIY